MSTRLLKFTFEKDNEVPQRVDKYLAENLKGEGISRELIQKLIKAGKMSVDGKVVKKPSYLLEETAEVVLEMDPEVLPPIEVKPEKVDFEILWEDEYLVAVNKPRGIVVHPGAGNWEGTLVAGLLYEKISLASNDEFYRPGIVHRLDKVTSGVLLVAKSTSMLNYLSEQFRERKIKKEYHALCEGRLPAKSGKIDLPLKSSPQDKKVKVDKSGREAITFFTLKDYSPTCNLSYVVLHPKTGRTHQLRVHLSYIKTPILGDKLYGAKGEFTSAGIALHAYKITFYHPYRKENMEITAPLPEDFLKVWEKC